MQETVDGKPVLGYGYADFMVDPVGHGFARGFKIVPGLEIHPELGLHSKKRPSRKAVSVVIPRFPWTISLMRRGGTPTAWAK